jgi:hypothetical protein
MYELKFDLCKKCYNVEVCYSKMNMLRHTEGELKVYNTCHHYNEEEDLNDGTIRKSS